MKKKLVDELYQRKVEISKRLTQLSEQEDHLNATTESTNDLNLIEKERKLLQLERQQIEYYLEIILA